MDAPAISPEANGSENLVYRIRNDIVQRTHDSIRNLEVSIAGGAVVVSGRTSRYYYKQLTTRAVFDLISDLKLDNQVEIDRESGT